MSKMIQLRNVPDALHRSLKARAAMAGMSLSDYLLAEIKEIAERPPWRSCGSVYINASRCGAVRCCSFGARRARGAMIVLECDASAAVDWLCCS